MSIPLPSSFHRVVRMLFRMPTLMLGRMPGRLPFRVLASLLAAASVAGCASLSGGQDHRQHHGGQSTSGSSGSCGSSGASAAGTTGGSVAAGCAGRMRQADKEAMCARYRSMRDAPNEQSRQAMMGGMSPEMRERHMEMMRQQCQ